MRYAELTNSFTAKAKFAGKCGTCKEKINKGDEMFAYCWSQSREWHRFHNTDKCHPDKVNARLAAALDMKNAVSISRTEQQAWSDVTTIAIPILNTELNEAELRQALSQYNQSSWGALRWNTYNFVRVEDGKVIATEYNNLCD